jgi:hypothetical protein
MRGNLADPVPAIQNICAHHDESASRPPHSRRLLMKGSRLVMALATSVLLAGCASAGAKQAVTRDPNVITADEIAQNPSSPNAYDLIQRLRPSFLRTRGAVHGTAAPGGSSGFEAVDVVVYLNEARLGGTEQLRQLQTTDIREIRYYNSSDATTKWGTGHTAGAIQVISR